MCPVQNVTYVSGRSSHIRLPPWRERAAANRRPAVRAATEFHSQIAKAQVFCGKTCHGLAYGGAMLQIS
jgi:hypothetical protein